MNDLAYLVIAAIALAVLVGIRRRREWVRHNLRGLAIAIVVGLIGFGIAQSRGAGDVAWFWGIAAGATALAMRPRRSRYIPAAERRKVIAEYERTGRKYSSKRYHLHHEVPFARGGSNTADNLRVIDKPENLRRGAKSPWWDLFGRP